MTDQCDFGSVRFVMTGMFSKNPSSDTRSDSKEMSANAGCASKEEGSAWSLSKHGYWRDGRRIGSREYTSSPSSVEDATVLEECLCCL